MKNINEISNQWIGTKFHYFGRIKKNKYNNGGVDCIGLIIKIGEELGAIGDNNKNIIFSDFLNYSRYPNKKELYNSLIKNCRKIKQNNIKTGDLIYFNFENNLEHIGILINNNEFLHCSAISKSVILESLNEYWKNKIKDIFRFKFK